MIPAPQTNPLADALDRLAHTARTHRLAPEQSERLKHAAEQILAALRPAMERWGTLRLRVEPFRLVWRGKTVYEQSNRAESLAFRLYRDGIGAIAFEPTLDRGELQHFVELLAIAPELSEHIGEDLATRLWAEPLHSIWVTERPMIPRRLLDLVPNPQDLMAEVTDALIFFESGVGDATATPKILVSPKSVATHWQTLASGALRPDGSITGQPPEPEVSRIATRGALTELSELLRAATLSSETTIDSDLLKDLYLGLIRAQVGFGEELPVRQLVRGLRGLYEWCRGSSQLERTTMLDTVAEQVASPESLSQALLNTSSGLSNMDLGWIPTFFAEYNRCPAEDYLPLFGHNLTSAALVVLAETVWQMAGESTDIWERVLVQIDGDIAAEALSVPMEHGEDDFVAQLCQIALQHHHPAVRAVALAHLPHDNARRTKSMLTDALRDREGSVRRAAIEQLGLSGDPSLGIFLVDRVRRMDLMGTSHDEQRAIYTALARLGGDRYLSLLLGQLQLAEERLAAGGDSPQEDAAKTAEGVLEAVALMGSAAASQQLLARQSTAPERLGKAYQKALEALKHAKDSPVLSFAPQKPITPTPHDESSEDNSLSELFKAYLNEDGSLESMELMGDEPVAARGVNMLAITPSTFNEPHSSQDTTPSLSEPISDDDMSQLDEVLSTRLLLIDDDETALSSEITDLIDDLMKTAADAGNDPDSES